MRNFSFYNKNKWIYWGVAAWINHFEKWIFYLLILTKLDANSKKAEKKKRGKIVTYQDAHIDIYYKIVPKIYEYPTETRSHKSSDGKVVQIHTSKN